MRTECGVAKRKVQTVFGFSEIEASGEYAFTLQIKIAKDKKPGKVRKINKKRLPCTHVRLHYPEYIFFCVQAICKPADARYRTLFHSHFATMLLYLF